MNSWMKSDRINVRVTEDLRQRLERLAAGEGMSLGELARMLFREGVAGTRAPDRRQMALLRDVEVQLRGLAVNMNQIARRSNIHADEPLEQETLANLSATAKHVVKLIDVLSTDVRRIVDWRERARGTSENRAFSLAEYESSSSKRVVSQFEIHRP